MITTTKRSFTSLKGVTINKGERVTVLFDVKRKSTGEPFPQYIRLVTADGRRVVTSKFKAAGIRVPTTRTFDSWGTIARSVFGNKVEPDGWDSEGSPSWLLVLGLV